MRSRFICLIRIQGSVSILDLIDIRDPENKPGSGKIRTGSRVLGFIEDVLNQKGRLLKLPTIFIQNSWIRIWTKKRDPHP